MILKIGNQTFDFFNTFNLTLKYDSIASTFSISLYFSPENQIHKSAFNPSSYSLVKIEHEGERLLTGYLISSTFSHSSKKTLISIGGYSLPGVLQDCQIPTNLYPLQSDGLSLKQIADKLTKPFGINVIIDSVVLKKSKSILEDITDTVKDAVTKVLPIAIASETKTIKAYLTELTAQKNVVLTHTAKGSLLFTRANTRKTPLINHDGGFPFTKMTLSVNGQSMHSEITVQKQVSMTGGNAGEAKVKNPFVNRLRPKVVSQSIGDDNDTLQAAKNVLASEIKGIKLRIEMDRWDIDGKLVIPDNTILVHNHEIYLYKKRLWFIESVSLIETDKKRTAILECVLPAVYDGSTPIDIF